MIDVVGFAGKPEHLHPSSVSNSRTDEITRLRADLAAVTEERDRLREVVKRADSYIHNGIELGFIRHCDTPEDPAYHTPRIVRKAARAAIEGVKAPASPKGETHGR